MITNIFINIGLLWVLWLILRRPHLHSSLGLPLVYLAGLELIHLPGAYAHSLPWATFTNTYTTELGFTLTTVAACCFVVGVWLARLRSPKGRRFGDGNSERPCRLQPRFLKFCLLAGWLFTFILTPLTRLPTIGAFVTFASNLWIVGIILALPLALESRQIKRIIFWIGSMLIFPTFVMVFGGFLSYGAASTMVCSFSSLVSARKAKRALVMAVLVAMLGISFFVTYFIGRDDFRDVVWSGAETQSRVVATREIFDNFAWIDPSNPEHLEALDERLNQNYFVGLSAQRLQDGSVRYLKGKSLSDGVLALIPRALWPEKNIEAGSGTIVADMTGLNLSKSTSFGVGNVMEAYINFAMPGIVIGFLLFGYFLGRLDYHAALADFQGDTKKLMICVLPAVAIIQPNGSFVEIMGGAVMSWIAAIYWHKMWRWWAGRRANGGLSSVPPYFVRPPVVLPPSRKQTSHKEL